MKEKFEFKSFIDEFIKSAEKYPDSVAISYQSEKILFSELQESVTIVSRYLKKNGIKKGDTIALWMNKSPDYIKLILGIWKIGGVFLPLDKNTPSSRVDWILNDARAKLLVTDKNDYSENMKSDCSKVNARLLVPYKHEELDSIESNLKIQSQDTAYIIYTSGSTGSPKGVTLTHEGIVNFLKEQINVFQVSNRSRILQYLSIGFDASLSEIGISLLSGAMLRIEAEEHLKDINFLPEILWKEGITHICLPPALLPMLEIEKIPNSLDTIIIGGEVCPVETVRKWSTRFRIVNVYGPTEATVCSSLIVCKDNWNKPLIGYPIPNREFHIFDENRIPIKNGEIGELFLSGVGLAKEYLNQMKLTNEKFIFINGTRMYKTGDMVRMHSANEIEFIGRIDHQFKLRGNLIEPSEVESQLCAHPLVSFAHVRKKELNKEALVAYIFLKDMREQIEEIELSKLLKLHLKKTLPYWMVPDRFVVLEKIPLNKNDKLDISGLPDIDFFRDNSVANYVEPLTEMENQLCEIFRRLLFVSPIGLKDDFYDLGGDSLTTISLLSECSLLGINLSADAFAKDPTIEGIISVHESKSLKLENVEFLRGEAELDEEILCLIHKSKPVKQKFSKILLTGATGFLGSRVLWELNQKNEIEIYCIVRDLSGLRVTKIIESQLAKQGVQIENWDRIHFLDGDITCSNFRLKDIDWNYLISNIDSVLHFAAEVNLIQPYVELKKVNVEGTKEVLKFCLTGIQKKLHYASTLSVFVSSDDARKRYYETDRLETMNAVYGGYAQSKWVSEKFLLNAIDAGFPTIQIYRFGLITGDSKLGSGKKDDFFTRFLQAIIHLKAIPTLNENVLKVDVTPVDFAARIFTMLSETEANQYIFHIANPNSLLFENVKNVLKEIIPDILEMTPFEFIESIKKIKEIDPYLYLSLSRLLINFDKFDLIRPLDLFQATGVEFDFTNVKNYIPDYNELCPKPDYKLLQKYITQSQM